VFLLILSIEEVKGCSWPKVMIYCALRVTENVQCQFWRKGFTRKTKAVITHIEALYSIKVKNRGIVNDPELL